MKSAWTKEKQGRGWVPITFIYKNMQSDLRLWIKINLKKNELDLKELNLHAKIKSRTL